MKQLSILILLTTLLSACGSESGSSPDVETANNPGPATPAPTEATQADAYGYLIDSPVEGLRYKSGTHEGVTDADGKFGYITGENIEFYIGNTMIAYADTPKALLTPYDFADGSLYDTLDILRILQTLDDDGDPNNGIQISKEVHELAVTIPITPVRFPSTFPPDDIDHDILWKLSGVTSAGARSVVEPYDAYIHFSDTMDGFIDDLEVKIQSVADNTSCSRDEQCVITELDTRYTFYCPPDGPSYIHSNADIDRSEFDNLIAERSYWVEARQNMEPASGIIESGVCYSFKPPVFLVCNDLSKRCETGL